MLIKKGYVVKILINSKATIKAATFTFILGLFIQMYLNMGGPPHHPQPRNVSKYLCHFHSYINSFKKDFGALLWGEVSPQKDMLMS